MRRKSVFSVPFETGVPYRRDPGGPDRFKRGPVPDMDMRIDEAAAAFIVAFLHCSRSRPLHQPVVLEAEVASVADDDVVQDLDAEHLSGLDESAGQEDVLLARLDVAARMIVDEDDRRRRLADRGPEGLPG